MSGKSHVAWSFFEDFHRGENPGCIWRHAPGWGDTPCHYARNGYQVSATRVELYNQDHRGRAKALGYVLDAPAERRRRGALVVSSLIGQEVSAKAESWGKGEDFRSRFERRFGSSMKWLSLSEQGWHYGYVLRPEEVPKAQRGRAPQPTFQVKDEDRQGYGAWYPYHHNYHHMIPQGALHEYLIGDDKLSRRRVELICASGWNINHGRNIVLLPQEVAVSRIVGLPAHCPWGLKSHPVYSRSMKDKLKKARRRLNRAIKTGTCEDTAKVKGALEVASDSILEQIKSMRPGRQLSRVK